MPESQPMPEQDKTLEIVVAGYLYSRGKVLLVHHKKLNAWLPFGGHIEDNETPDDALRREAREELGTEIEFLQYPKSRRGNNKEYALPFYINVHHITPEHLHYCLFYLCEPKSKIPIIALNEQESDTYGWFGRQELIGSSVSLISDSVKQTSLQAITTALELK